jgi:hypothetical protein
MIFVFGEQLAASSYLELTQHGGVHERRETSTGPAKTLLSFPQHRFVERDRSLLTCHEAYPTTVGIRATGLPFTCRYL